MPWVSTSIVLSQMESPKVRDMASITCKHQGLVHILRHEQASLFEGVGRRTRTKL